MFVAENVGNSSIALLYWKLYNVVSKRSAAACASSHVVSSGSSWLNIIKVLFGLRIPLKES